MRRLLVSALLTVVCAVRTAGATSPIDAETADRIRIRAHLLRTELALRSENTFGWPRELVTARAASLDRLHAYAERGEFPRNVHTPGREPIFIDDRGIACAVGALVIASGALELAETIARDENGALLLDMRTPGLSDWVAGSGLTAEDAALIQPQYCDCADEPSLTCGSDGKTYTNACVAVVCAGVTVVSCGPCPDGGAPVPRDDFPPASGQDLELPCRYCAALGEETPECQDGGVTSCGYCDDVFAILDAGPGDAAVDTAPSDDASFSDADADHELDAGAGGRGGAPASTRDEPAAQAPRSDDGGGSCAVSPRNAGSTWLAALALALVFARSTRRRFARRARERRGQVQLPFG
jgi:hypothetical protein